MGLQLLTCVPTYLYKMPYHDPQVGTKFSTTVYTYLLSRISRMLNLDLLCCKSKTHTIVIFPSAYHAASENTDITNFDHRITEIEGSLKNLMSGMDTVLNTLSEVKSRTATRPTAK